MPLARGDADPASTLNLVECAACRGASGTSAEAAFGELNGRPTSDAWRDAATYCNDFRPT
jgi:hypothetical protein